MDFSKAILKLHNVAVDNFYKDLTAKLSDPNWVAQNNEFTKQGFTSNNISITVRERTPNAIFIAAELKKRFDSEGWRVLTDATETEMKLVFNK